MSGRGLLGAVGEAIFPFFGAGRWIVRPVAVGTFQLHRVLMHPLPRLSVGFKSCVLLG